MGTNTREKDVDTGAGDTLRLITFGSSEQSDNLKPLFFENPVKKDKFNLAQIMIDIKIWILFCYFVAFVQILWVIFYFNSKNLILCVA